MKVLARENFWNASVARYSRKLDAPGLDHCQKAETALKGDIKYDFELSGNEWSSVCKKTKKNCSGWQLCKAPSVKYVLFSIGIRS